MQILKKLWTDDTGAVLTAEVVMVGTMAILGSVVGLNMASTAVNDELSEVAFAIRSLDQSYGYQGRASCGAWSAGSCFVQQRVETSLQELGAYGEAETARIQEQVEAQRKLSTPTVIPHPDAPAANELPEKKPDPKPVPKKKKSKDKDKDDDKDDDGQEV